MTTSIWIWIGFSIFVLTMLALDLGVFHRKSHNVGMKEALTWSGVWIALVLLFNAGATFPGTGVASLAKSGERRRDVMLKLSRRKTIR